MEMRSYPIPEDLAGGALVEVEVCGMCGTDVAQYQGTVGGSTWPKGPQIIGHEVVGIVRAGDPLMLRRWGVELGDRVAVEPNLPCGVCRRCLGGLYVACDGWDPRPMSFGFIPASVEPSLWGGYSEVMYLPRHAVAHKVPDELDAATAGMFNAFANAFHWTCALPRLEPGQSVLVLGVGQRGLAAVATARAAGAGTVIASGLARDGSRLEMARRLGADGVVVSGVDDIPAVVRDLNGGELADVVVDCSSVSTEPVVQAVHGVRDGGTVVLGGLKEGRLVDGFPVDEVILRTIRLIGARSAGWFAYEQALRLLVELAPRLAPLRTHQLSLEEADKALRILGREVPGEDPLYVSISPGAPGGNEPEPEES